jgi:hypothetical protein
MCHSEMQERKQNFPENLALRALATIAAVQGPHMRV